MSETVTPAPEFTLEPLVPSEPSGRIDYVAQAIENALTAGREKGGRQDGPVRG